MLLPRFMDLPTQLTMLAVVRSYQRRSLLRLHPAETPYVSSSRAFLRIVSSSSTHKLPKISKSVHCSPRKLKHILPILSFSGFTTAHFLSSLSPKLPTNSAHLLAAPPPLVSLSALCTDKIPLSPGLFCLSGILHSLPIRFELPSHSSSGNLTFKTLPHGAVRSCL